VAQPTGDDRTSLLFSLQDQPGALSAAIEPFKRLGINLSEIESRPARPRPWRHFFFVDIEGHATEPKVAEAIAEFSQRCTFVKVLGAYPKSAAV
jgi:chorismate mutase/prephenate dehydratase